MRPVQPYAIPRGSHACALRRIGACRSHPAGSRGIFGKNPAPCREPPGAPDAFGADRSRRPGKGTGGGRGTSRPPRRLDFGQAGSGPEKWNQPEGVMPIWPQSGGAGLDNLQLPFSAAWPPISPHIIIARECTSRRGVPTGYVVRDGCGTMPTGSTFPGSPIPPAARSV